MLVPEDIDSIDYNEIFKLEMQSVIDWSEAEAKREIERKERITNQLETEENKVGQKFRRMLEESEENDKEVEFDEWDVGEGDPEENVNLKFDWHVVGHDPKEISIKLDFEVPQNVTSTNFGSDFMKSRMKNLLVFVSAETGLSLDQDSVIGAKDGKFEIKLQVPT